MIPSRPSARFSVTRAFRALRSDRRGNVLMIMAFAIIPLVLAAGIGIDYARAARMQTKMNAAADAAALFAVSKPMMQETLATAKERATAMFEAQVTDIPGLVYDPAKLSVTLTERSGTTNIRTADVTYDAQSINAFGKILGRATTAIGGTAVATSAESPDIDFYLMLDTSQSMLLPASSADLALMTTRTGGCAFACHTATAADNYLAIARSLNLVLRSDLVVKAVQDLTTTAQSVSNDTRASYRMAISSFDTFFRPVYPAVQVAGVGPTGDLDAIRARAKDAAETVYCKSGYRTCAAMDGNTNTNLTRAFQGALGVLPVAAGKGTRVLGDTPQAIRFIIADGMLSEAFNGNPNDQRRGPMTAAHASQCDAIKARGIRIAVLYTEYLPEAASDAWSITNIRRPYLDDDKISPPLIACASPGLFHKVTTDSDISAALASLFEKAVAIANLTK